MPARFKTIMCPVNLRHAEDAHSAYTLALQEARQHEARLWVVTVAPEIERNLNIYDSEKFWGQKLREFLEQNPPGDVQVDTKVLKGAAHRQIVKFATTNSVDLVVMEAANPRIRDYLLGTTASHVVTHAPCSVFIARKRH